MWYGRRRWCLYSCCANRLLNDTSRSFVRNGCHDREKRWKRRNRLRGATAYAARRSLWLTAQLMIGGRGATQQLIFDFGWW